MQVENVAPTGKPGGSSPSPLESRPTTSTPLTWRLAIATAILVLGFSAYALRETIGPRGQAVFGVLCFFGIVAMFSSNLRAVNWRTIGWGIALQIALALLVLKVPFVKAAFEQVKAVVISFIGFSDKGAEFVFGNLARPGDIALNPGKEFLFMFAFKALPPILFVSAFFTMLYHYGILQRIVRLMARVMVHLMRTSGAETLSVSANVFMGQTEAPLIVRPYVPRMTQSELFALMVSGFAHISGGMMVVYINYGADPVAVLTTCIMACPCSLYLSKLFTPELGKPETAGTVHAQFAKSPHVNGIDAIAAGTTDGLKLALNVAAMLIVFIAFVAMADAILGFAVKDLTLSKLFGWIFSPAAFLMGVELKDVSHVASLLGAKLSINEHYAYLVMKGWKATPDFMTERSYILAAFALTGFANFASVGIQLGGIGAIAPDRRHDLARLGLKALFVGFVATLLNAAIAGILL
ncbi:MAG TPA: nucleoside transporter C-terminal domain-containing protein [Candidatus Paceibacterota bacterium]|nr:nucleoside transporter C-terminal domain-containing protein [Candidatus Paceibacterota bacterium]